ncbi:MAG: STT3 domain-containing protein [Candidatus Ranarchaeia archaeon]
MRLPLFFKKARKAISQVVHRPRISIRRDSTFLVLSLVMIFISAVLVRMLPFFQDEALMRAFDPWFQWRATQYLEDHGLLAFFSWYDTLSWYPWGRDITVGNYPGTPFAAVIFYYVLRSLGIQADLFMVAYLLPAFMGGLTCIVIYFLGKELHNRKTGLIAAWFLTFSPGYIQRTLVGFFDNEAMGVFYIVLTLYFFIRSYKRESLISGVFAGITLGLLGATWGAYLYLTDLFPLFALILILLGRYNRKLLTSYSTTMGIGLLICAAVPRTGVSVITSMAGLPGVFVFGLMILIEVWPSIRRLFSVAKQKVPPKISENLWRITIGVIGIVVITLTALQLSGILPNIIEHVQTLLSGTGFMKLAGRYLTILDPTTRDRFQIIASVGEHLPTPWGYYFYNLWTILSFIPLGFYFLYKNPKEENILLILFGLTIVYFSASLIRIILILTPAVSLIAAYGISNLMKPFADILRGPTTLARRRRIRVQRMVTKEFAAFGFIALFLFLGLNATWGTDIARQSYRLEIKPEVSYQGTTILGNDVLEGIEYIRNELPNNIVIASWWDYGYWLTSNTNRSTVCDNATTNTTQIATVGYAMMTTNITESVRVFRQLGATHVFVYFGLSLPNIGGDEGKWQWMTKIAYQTSTDLGLNWDVAPEKYLNEVNNTVEPAFYNTTIYKLLRYGEPGGDASDLIYQIWASSSEGQRWINNPVTNLEFFKVEFFSSNHIFKLYRIDYDAYDQWLANSTTP